VRHLDWTDMATRPEPKPGISDIVLYKGGASRLPGHDEVLKLSSNENPFGVPESAAAALAATAHRVHRYPPSDHAGLRAAIAEVQGLDADRVICGAGSDEILTFLAQVYGGEGREAIYTEHGFSMYRICALSAGMTPVVVPEHDRVVDVDAILGAVTERTGLVYLTNPGNPTGTLLPLPEVERLADGLPPQVVLVLDGAYVEYAEGYDGGAALAHARDNVVMTRTFSKLYGLGGLRVGWAYGPQHIIDNLNRVRGPFNLGLPQLAAAEAAMRDRAWAERCRSENARLRDWLTDTLMDLGIDVDPSFANYVLARFRSAAEADDCETTLAADGIIVRKVAGYGFPEGLRITIGTEADCRRVAATIRRFKEGLA
jgi:histidinol-phosphate aminotransferase